MKGILIRPKADSDVLAAQKGRVAFVEQNLRGYGKTIIVEHAGKVSSVYSGVTEILTAPGRTVGRGDRIARLRLRNKSKADLYFAIYRSGRPQDPLKYLPEKN